MDKGAQHMINISACEFDEFEKYMSSQYGAAEFKEGWKIIKENRYVLYSEGGGEDQLIKMLNHLKFADNDSLKGFINFCTTYLIVQNMQC